MKGSKELKAVDYQVTQSSPWVMDSSATSAAPNVALLNGINIGDDMYTRDGRMIKMNTISIKGTVWYSGSATSGFGCNMRFMLVLDRQRNNTAWVAGDLGNILGGLTENKTDVTKGPFSFKRPDYAQRYAILSDFVISRDQWGTGEGPAKKTSTFKIFKKLNLPVSYSGISSSDTVISTNALYLIAFSDCQNANASPAYAPYVSWTGRLTFVDS